MTTCSGKHLEPIDNPHTNCLLYEIKTSGRDGKDLSIKFVENNARCKLEMTDEEEAPNKLRFHVRIYVKDVLDMLIIKKCYLEIRT